MDAKDLRSCLTRKRPLHAPQMRGPNLSRKLSKPSLSGGRKKACSHARCRCPLFAEGVSRVFKE